MNSQTNEPLTFEEWVDENMDSICNALEDDGTSNSLDYDDILHETLTEAYDEYLRGYHA